MLSKDLIEMLPLYQSHKIVRAGQIMRVIDERPRLIRIWLATHSVRLEPGTVAFKEVDLAPELYARYVPHEFDYLVVYEDGYVSISPRKAFEEGYVPVEDGAFERGRMLGVAANLRRLAQARITSAALECGTGAEVTINFPSYELAAELLYQLNRLVMDDVAAQVMAGKLPAETPDASRP